VVGIALCFYYSWQMGLVLLALMPLVGFSVWFLTKVTAESAGETGAAYARAGGLAMECISGLRTVSALGAQEDQVDQYFGNLKTAQEAGVRKSWRLGLASGLMFASRYYHIWTHNPRFYFLDWLDRPHVRLWKLHERRWFRFWGLEVCEAAGRHDGLHGGQLHGRGHPGM